MQFELTNTQPDDQDDQPIEWVKWYDGVKEKGDTFTMNVDRISFKDENQPVFFVIDETNNQGTSVFAAHHPKATFTDATPHGVRLANAIGRCFDLSGSVDADALCAAVNDHEGEITLTVSKTDKGILWTVSTA